MIGKNATRSVTLTNAGDAALVVRVATLENSQVSLLGFLCLAVLV
jgi:hypothetical protein